MPKLLVLLLVLPLLLFSSVKYAAEPKGNQPQTPGNVRNDIQQLKRDIKANTDDVAILRRDQINYRLEKDLLKEAYASNLQSINIIVAIVFGVVTLVGGVLGYLGVRSIRELRADYAKELDQLKTVKTSLEIEIASLGAKQVAVEGRVGDLTKTNEEQDRRLKALELIEKVSELVRTRQFAWALEYISIGLGSDPKNTRLLNLKAACHGKQGEFAALIDTCNRILEVEPEDVSVVCNLLEALAITNKAAEFEVLYAKHKAAVDAHSAGALIVYLKTLLALTRGDIRNAKAQLAPFANNCPEGAAARLGSWQFDEPTLMVSRMPDGEVKVLAQKIVQFFQGSLPTQELKAVLA